MYKICFLVLVAISFSGCAPEKASNAKEYPADFMAQLSATRNGVDAVITDGLQVPTPKDMAGGSTHEVHKRNWKTLRDAGALYRLTGEEKYAEFLRDALLQYAAVYRSWPTHPTNRSYATGRIFWQCLNDANWLVYVSEGYADIYDWLSPADREKINNDLFRPRSVHQHGMERGRRYL